MVVRLYSELAREMEQGEHEVLKVELQSLLHTCSSAILLNSVSQVRNERNVAREEIKQLQTKLDSAIKESNSYRRQKQNLEIHNEQMRKELEQIHILLLKHVGKVRSSISIIHLPPPEPSD